MWRIHRLFRVRLGECSVRCVEHLLSIRRMSSVENSVSGAGISVCSVSSVGNSVSGEGNSVSGVGKSVSGEGNSVPGEGNAL